MSRTAGVRARSSSSGQFTSSRLRDDPLHFTGGGRTDLDLQLLFDVGEANRAQQQYTDVRQLTRPLMNLAENSQDSRRPPIVRFVWGKAWNIPGIILAAAERFDLFTTDGLPQRSWLTIQLTRAADPTKPASSDLPDPPLPVDAIDSDAEPTGVVTAVGDTNEDAYSGVRLDSVAAEVLGNPLNWRLLTAYNDLDDPLRTPPGVPLKVPAVKPGRTAP